MGNDAAEQSYFENLKNFLTTRFNANFQEYDMLRKHIEKLARENSAYQGPLLTGATSMIMNRVNGAYALYKSPQVFYRAGISGYKWAYYYSFSPTLRNDVSAAGAAAVYNQLWPISLTSLTKAAVTGGNIYKGSANQLTVLANERVRQQRDALGASVIFGMGVTSLLKQAGAVAQNDLQRLLAKGVLRSWQVTGLLGICFGFSRLDETMHETGVFGSTLRTARDNFYLTSPNPLIQQCETILKNIKGRP